MFSCRPNPTIKFYLNKNHGSTINAPRKDTVINLQKTNPEEIVEYPDHLEQHRRNIILDYRNKMDMTKMGRKRMSVQIGQNRGTKCGRVKTSRQGSQRKGGEDKKILFRSTEPVNTPKKTMRLSTINFSLYEFTPNEEEIKATPMRDSSIEFQRETLTTFQRNALKALKAKQEIKIKKKLISYEIDERHHEQAERFQENACQRSFRIVTEPRR